jgi:hypothetical protein
MVVIQLVILLDGFKILVLYLPATYWGTVGTGVKFQQITDNLLYVGQKRVI